jgi:phospholipid/cholesterol/gamma-HCH transport system ATP-binding protein
MPARTVSAEPQQTPAAAVEVENLEMRFGQVEVLRGVSFRVPAGCTLCILGGSGGGKSTLLKIMIGALRPTAGRVRIAGHEITALTGRALDRARRHFGVMFQGGALLNSLTVAENVALPLEYHSKLEREIIERAVKIKLHQVDLLHAADRMPSELSGGMQKRAAVARALALDPRILFYDEPSAGLDPIATSRIDQLVNRLKTSMGITNVVVTHVMESVERIADHVVMLDRGRVILDGSLAELQASADPRVQQFLHGDLEGPTTSSISEKDYMRDLLF